MARAMRLCPQAEVVMPRMDRYAEVSSQVMDLFHDFSPKVEALSLDEAFLDMTGAEGIFGPPEEMGRKLREAVREKLGLPVSVGISGTKYVAKVASDSAKPDGLLVVPPDDARAFLAPLPVQRLWGVGPKTAPRLHAAGLRTIGDVANASPSFLTARLGSLGAHLHALSVVDDLREVVPNRDAQSVGWERTLAEDIQGEKAIAPLLLQAADEVARRLRKHELVRPGRPGEAQDRSFQIHTRQATLPEATDSAGPLYEAALELLPAFDLRNRSASSASRDSRWRPPPPNVRASSSPTPPPFAAGLSTGPWTQ